MRSRIAAKIILYTIALVIVIAVFLGWFFVRHETEVVKTELEERANTILNNLAYNSEYGVLVGDKETIARLLDGIIREKDIAYAIVEDKEGEVHHDNGSEP